MLCGHTLVPAQQGKSFGDCRIVRKVSTSGNEHRETDTIWPAYKSDINPQDLYFWTAA